MTMATLDLTEVYVRFGEADDFEGTAAVVVLPCATCIESGDDCGRHYAVLRIVADSRCGGRDFDISLEPAEAERIAQQLSAAARVAAARQAAAR